MIKFIAYVDRSLDHMKWGDHTKVLEGKSLVTQPIYFPALPAPGDFIAFSESGTTLEVSSREFRINDDGNDDEIWVRLLAAGISEKHLKELGFN